MAGGLLVIVATVMLIAASALFTPLGPRTAAFVFDERTVAGFTVGLEGVGGPSIDRLRAETVTFSDADGVWLRLEGVRVDWRLFDLARWRVGVGRVEIARLDYARAPVRHGGEDAPAREDDADGTSWDVVVDAARIATLSTPFAPDLTLDAALDWRAGLLRDGALEVDAIDEDGVERVDVRLACEARDCRVKGAVDLHPGAGVGSAGVRRATLSFHGDARQKTGGGLDALSLNFDAALGGADFGDIAAEGALDYAAGRNAVMSASFLRGGAPAGGVKARLAPPGDDATRTGAVALRVEPRAFSAAGAPGFDLEGDLSWNPAARRLAIRGPFVLEGLPERFVQNGAAQGALDGAVTPQETTAGFTIEGARSDGGAVEASGRIVFDPAARILRVSRFEAESGGLLAKATGETTLAGAGLFNLTFEADPERLASEFGAAAARLSSARAAATLRGRSWTEWDARIGAEAALQGGDPLREALGETVIANAEGSVADDRLTLAEASLEAGALTARAKGVYDVDAATLDLQGEARLAETTIRGVTASAPVSLAFDARGPIAALLLRAEATAPALRAGGLGVEGVSLRAELSRDAAVRVEVMATTPAGAVDLFAEGPLDGDLWTMREFRMAAGAVRFAGAGRLDLAGGGDILRAEGALERDRGLLTERARLDLGVGATRAEARLQTADGVPFFGIQSARANANFADRAQGALSVAGALGDLAISAEPGVDGPRLRARGTLLGEEVATLKPFTLTEDRRFDALFGFGAGRVRATGDLSGAAPMATVIAENIPAAALARAFPRIAPEGRFDVEASYRGGDNPVIDARFDAQGVQAAGRPDLPFDGRMAGRLALPGRLSLTADLTSAGRGARDFDMTARLDLDRTNDAPWMESAIDGSADLSGEAAFLASFALEPGRAFVGALDGNVAVSGTLAHPVVKGEIGVREARFDEARTGFRLRELEGRLVLKENAADLNAMAGDGDGGALDFEGRIERAARAEDAAAGGWRGDARLTLRNFRALRQEFADAWASGEIAVAKETSRPPDISGDVNVTRAVVDPLRIPRARNADIPQLVIDRVRGGDGADGADTAAANGAGAGLSPNFDVRLHGPRRIFIRSRSIESEWRMDVRLAQSPGTELRAEGFAEALTGRFTVAGAPFELETARIDFSGAIEDAPVRLDASHPFEGGVAYLRVTGPLGDPTIALDSTPSLPDAEILSRVLFGNASGELSVVEQAQLSEALAAFATGRNLDLVGAVRDRLGLDRLTVRSDEDQTALITGGRYIGRDVYVELTAGASDAFQSTRITWRLRPNLVFRSEISRERDANLSLRWALDF